MSCKIPNYSLFKELKELFWSRQQTTQPRLIQPRSRQITTSTSTSTSTSTLSTTVYMNNVEMDYVHHIGYIHYSLKEIGSYIVIVNSSKGPNCIFGISKSDRMHYGDIKKIIESKWTLDNYEISLNIKWNACEFPLLSIKFSKRYGTFISLNNLHNKHDFTFHITVIGN